MIDGLACYCINADANVVFERKYVRVLRRNKKWRRMALHYVRGAT
jgi:hypothetical protein